jgi:hypothetical protein
VSGIHSEARQVRYGGVEGIIVSNSRSIAMDANSLKGRNESLAMNFVVLGNVCKRTLPTSFHGAIHAI